MAQPFPVCNAAELPVGAKKIVEIGSKSVGVFNVHGKYFAIRNVCPHQFAPLCKGRVTGTTAPSKVGEYVWEKEGEIIRCPWHGWEFDITTGRSIFNPHKVRVKTYDVTVELPDGTQARQTIDSDAPDPGVETFPVTLESGMIVVHV
jgi:3-phenylpropionate/trans-cinnamate dioxygenase ferredoxin subunit